MKINFVGVEGQTTFDPIPVGKYTVEVTDFRERKAGENAKNPGAPIISWEYTVTEHEDEKLVGRTVWDNMPIIPPSDQGKGTLWRVKGFLDAAGFDVDEKEIDFDPAEVVGSTLQIKVKIEKGKNPQTGEEYEPRNSVSGFYPAAE